MVGGSVFCLMESGRGGIGVGLEKKLSGLAFLFKLQACQNFMKDFWVRQEMKGYWRSQKCRDSRSPVLFEILGRVLAQLVFQCSSAYEVSLFKAAFSLAFFGAFWIGELVGPSKKVQGGMWATQVTCGEDRLSLVLRKSKTDQVGRGR